MKLGSVSALICSAIVGALVFGLLLVSGPVSVLVSALASGLAAGRAWLRPSLIPFLLGLAVASAGNLSEFDFSVFYEAGAAAADNLPGFDLRCSSSVLLARLCMASYFAKVIFGVGTCRAVRRSWQTCCEGIAQP